MIPTQTKESLLEKHFNQFELVNNNSVLLQLQDLYLFAVSYKTAPVAIREKFSIAEYNLKEAYQNLKIAKSLKSYLILSTCNRTEIYFKADDLGKAQQEINKFFNKFLGLEEKVAKEYSIIIKANEVVEHVFKLACGLDSLVLGECQVLSQLKTAYSVSQKEQTLDNTLELLFQCAIKSTKEVHKKTTLSKSSQSISSAAVDLANKIAGPLKTKSVMVLGAGGMAKLALEQIVKIGGSKDTVVLNRSPHRVIEFSEKYKISKSVPFEDVYEAMNDVDIVIAATGAPHFIIFAEQFNKIRKDSQKPLLIFDISMPRNIDSEFGKMSNIKLFDIDSLQVIYNQATSMDAHDLKLSNEIISEGVFRFYEKIEKQNIDPIIKEIKEKFDKTRKEKLKSLKGEKQLFTSEEVDYITKNITNTILHLPLTNLKRSKLGGSLSEKEQLLRDLFGL